jgi:hypothetical protein
MGRKIFLVKPVGGCIPYGVSAPDEGTGLYALKRKPKLSLAYDLRGPTLPARHLTSVISVVPAELWQLNSGLVIGHQVDFILSNMTMLQPGVNW